MINSEQEHIELQKKLAYLKRLKEQLEEAEAGLTDEDKRIREDCENSLATFIKYMWKSIDTSTYKHNWHIDAIAEHLEAMIWGDIKHLLINVSPRCMKPVSVDGLVLTKNGLIELKNIKIGDEVFTHKNRWKKVLNVFDQGEIPALKIKTDRGRSLSAAPDHPFLTPDGWKKLEDINSEDIVGISGCTVEDCGTQTVSNEEARLIGYLVGDGHCTGTPNVTVADDLEAEDIKYCVSAVGFVPKEQSYKLAKSGSKIRRISITASEKEDGRTVKGYLGPVKRWLQKRGILEKSSYNKNIPECILLGNKDVVCNFIGAYWACDGTIGNKGAKKDGSLRTDLVIRCDSVNEKFIHDLQILFTRIGINSSINKKVRELKTKKQGDFYTHYTLTLNSQNDCYKFSKLIFSHHEKFNKMLKIYNRRFDFDREIWGDVVREIKPNGVEKCKCLEVEDDHSFVVNGFIVHNSILGSVSLTPWAWIQQEKSYRSGPETSFLYASYGQKLSFEHSLKTRTLLNSPLHKKLWGNRFQLLKDQNTITKFSNSMGGYRMATSVGGTLTGSGAAIIGVDDPHNTVEMESEDVVQGVLDWWDTSLSTRLNDPVEGSFFVIMQRLRENDLSGHILDQNGGEWTHLCLPMEYESSRHCTTSIGFSDPRKEENELMWPDRIDRKALDALKKKLGIYGASGQLQQAPVPKGGGIIKEDFWQPWTEKFFPSMEFIVAVCDTAYTEDTENDYSACSVIGIYRDAYDLPKIMVMHAWQERLGLHDLVLKISATAKKYKVDRVLIENKASGISVSQEIRRLFGNEIFGVTLVEPRGDKMARLMSVEPLFAEKIVFIPFIKDESTGNLFPREWAEMVIKNVTQFPKAKHDDITDTISAGVGYLRNMGLIYRREEKEADLQSQMEHKGKLEPLYDC